MQKSIIFQYFSAEQMENKLSKWHCLLALDINWICYMQDTYIETTKHNWE